MAQQAALVTSVKTVNINQFPSSVQMSAWFWNLSQHFSPDLSAWLDVNAELTPLPLPPMFYSINFQNKSREYI